MDKRIQTIKTRGNFFEIYRNRDLFTKEDYNELLKLSLAKADNSELPPEFRDYAAHLQEYEQKNPGKFYLAAKFGAKIAGSKTRDLMSQKDYSKIFGDAPMTDDYDYEEFEAAGASIMIFAKTAAVATSARGTG